MYQQAGDFHYPIFELRAKILYIDPGLLLKPIFEGIKVTGSQKYYKEPIG